MSVGNLLFIKGAATQVLSDIALNSTLMASERARRHLHLMAILMAGAGFVFVLAGFHIWAGMQYGPAAAFAMTGAMMLAIAAISVLFSLMILQKRQQAIQQIKNECQEVVTEVFKTIDHEIGDTVSENPKTALLVAAAAGFLADRQL